MADPLSVNPDDLRKSGGNLADVSARFKQVLTSLRDDLAALGSPWGDDKTGRQFANGDSGYLAQKDWVSDSIDAKARLLDAYSKNLSTAATDFEQSDQ
jgi:uncharacterized protein YukE